MDFQYKYNRLRSQMALKGITSKQLSEIIGMEEGTLSRKLNNKNYFLQWEISTIASALDITDDQIGYFFYNKS